MIKLLVQITSLTPDALLALQKEFLYRGEKEYVLKIAEYMASSRFRVPEELVTSYYIELRKKNLDKFEIEDELKESLGIEKDYVEFIISSLKSKARENIIIGVVLIIIPLLLILLSAVLGGYLGIGAFLILGFGIWRLIKGIELMKIL